MQIGALESLKLSDRSLDVQLNYLNLSAPPIDLDENHTFVSSPSKSNTEIKPLEIDHTSKSIPDLTQQTQDFVFPSLPIDTGPTVLSKLSTFNSELPQPIAETDVRPIQSQHGTLQSLELPSQSSTQQLEQTNNYSEEIEVFRKSKDNLENKKTTFFSAINKRLKSLKSNMESADKQTQSSDDVEITKSTYPSRLGYYSMNSSTSSNNENKPSITSHKIEVQKLTTDEALQSDDISSDSAYVEQTSTKDWDNDFQMLLAKKDWIGLSKLARG